MQWWHAKCWWCCVVVRSKAKLASGAKRLWLSATYQPASYTPPAPQVHIVYSWSQLGLQITFASCCHCACPIIIISIIWQFWLYIGLQFAQRLGSSVTSDCSNISLYVRFLLNVLFNTNSSTFPVTNKINSVFHYLQILVIFSTFDYYVCKHIYAYTFRKLGCGFGCFGEITPLVGFGPQTTLGVKWVATNAATILKISRPWAKPPRRKFDFRKVFCLLFFAARVT